MSENKRTFWLAVAGVGALIGSALIYHYYSSNAADDDETPSRDELVQQLKQGGLEEV